MWKKNILVVANVTAISDELLAALEARATSESATFHLILPASPLGGGREAARERLELVIERLHASGLEIDGDVADSDPMVAVMEAWDPGRYDGIIVSTLPMRLSKWLHAGLPERIAQLTGAPVTHVISKPPKPPAEIEPKPPHEKNIMGPLSVLSWGGRADDPGSGSVITTETDADRRQGC